MKKVILGAYATDHKTNVSIYFTLPSVDVSFDVHKKVARKFAERILAACDKIEASK